VFTRSTSQAELCTSVLNVVLDVAIYFQKKKNLDFDFRVEETLSSSGGASSAGFPSAV